MTFEDQTKREERGIKILSACYALMRRGKTRGDVITYLTNETELDPASIPLILNDLSTSTMGRKYWGTKDMGAHSLNGCLDIVQDVGGGSASQDGGG